MIEDISTRAIMGMTYNIGVSVQHKRFSDYEMALAGCFYCGMTGQW